MLKILLIFISINLLCTKIFSQNIGIQTGLKIPRYVSLKSNEVNLRVGSSKNYPIILTYNSINMPLKIIDEYQLWRKVIDFDGKTGWIHKSLIKGDRFAIIKNTNELKTFIHIKPKGKIIGEIGGGNIVKIKSCITKWCNIKFQKHRGWIEKEKLWGLINDEKINVSYFQPLIRLFWKINF